MAFPLSKPTSPRMLLPAESNRLYLAINTLEYPDDWTQGARVLWFEHAYRRGGIIATTRMHRVVRKVTLTRGPSTTSKNVYVVFDLDLNQLLAQRHLWVFPDKATATAFYLRKQAEGADVSVPGPYHISQRSHERHRSSLS